MQSRADSSSGFCNKYATLRFVVDAERNVSIPIGVAIWGNRPDSLRMRLPERDERFQGAEFAEAYPYLELVHSQIQSWLKDDFVPYQRERMEPLSDCWWDQVRKLLKFRVRFDEPKPIECTHPELELESLYEAVAKPKQKPARRKTRIEKTFRDAVGDSIVAKLSVHGTIPGYKQKPVEVFRHAQVEDNHLVVEVVNLAIPEAVRDADALASRLQRIIAGPMSNHSRFVLGYIASPSGLNGEAHMKEWIEEKSSTRMYDVVNESDQFASRIDAVLGDMRFGLFR